MNYEDMLYHRVNELEAKFAAFTEAVAHAERARVPWQLPGELGTVTVSGAGELLEVSLDVDEMRNYTAESLARQVLHGIQQAEHTATEQHAATLAVAEEEAQIR
ncbi:hypothetical protein [Amycolatopsis samaneae]|uniref:YbaB/EbfC DNA-binding family protein n=1 Tax=Amycolatopsis samaneae TaxID=664691 RepID=A0ABW5G8H3_9PSEU